MLRFSHNVRTGETRRTSLVLSLSTTGVDKPRTKAIVAETLGVLRRVFLLLLPITLTEDLFSYLLRKLLCFGLCRRPKRVSVGAKRRKFLLTGAYGT